MTVGPPLLEAAKNNDPAAIDMMVLYGHDIRCQIGGNPVAGTSVINTAKRLLEKNKPGVLFTDLSACNGYANGEIVAQTLTSPAIFISGVRDKMTPPRAAEAMARKVANGTMATVADSGHGVMAEQPEAMQKLLFDAISA
jgi:pimeloyl-ACP methyl ester carboxylesterase